MGLQVEKGSVLSERAEALLPLLDEHAEFADEARRAGRRRRRGAPPRRGCSTCGCRRCSGGSELDPVRSLEVIETLSYGDPSVGWVRHGRVALDRDGRAPTSGTRPSRSCSADGRLPVIAGQGTRPGTAVPHGRRLLAERLVELRVGHQARDAHPHARASSRAPGEPRIFVLPVEQATLIDNWDVLGLRGTGSIDYTIDSVFVPGELHATSPRPRRRAVAATSTASGIIGFAEICHSGWAIGVGRRILDELVAAGRRQGRPTGSAGRQRRLPRGLAKAEATYRSARAFVYEAWARRLPTPWSGAIASRSASTRSSAWRSPTSRAPLHEVAQLRVPGRRHHGAAPRHDPAAASATSHAGTQHVTSSPPVVQTCGRELAGLADGKVWQFLDLADP